MHEILKKENVKLKKMYLYPRCLIYCETILLQELLELSIKINAKTKESCQNSGFN